ncbi:MAG TPA: glycosyl hydrolase family 28-related protein [Anaeromyxobacteraceae bacterium]|nr:glycosyl hydrolase family 28-related protein [Anaeromyxobacteraceae bacterium]
MADWARKIAPSAVLSAAFLFAVTLLGSACSTSAGKGGAYALPADRVTTWNPGTMSRGGIAALSSGWPSTTALLPSGGDDAAAINKAIADGHAAHPSGVVVLLGAGTFIVNADYVAIDSSNTVLRGAGAGTTLLVKTNGANTGSGTATDARPVVIVGPSRWPVYQSNATLLTADGAKGAFSVNVADGTRFSSGMFALLDEVSGSTWQTDPQGRGQVLANGPWTSPSSPPDVVWWAHNPPFANDDPAAPTTPSPANGWASVGGDAAQWFSRPDRVQAEVKEIAGVSGNTVTFTSPLHKAFRASHHAQLTPPGDGGSHPSVHVTLSGLEGVSVSGGGDGAIRFENAAYCWARGVENTKWLGEGFAVNGSFRVEIRDSYVHDGAWPVPGGGGYALSLANGSAELLYENNINLRANKVMVVRASGAGSVIGYNYMDMGFIAYDDVWNEVGLNGSHMVGGYQMLFEGNWGFNFDSDSTHGSATRHTVYRNWLRGWRGAFTNYMTGSCPPGTDGCSPQEPTVDDAYDMALSPSIGGPYRTAGGCRYSYYFNFVGNVLGAPGKMSGWSDRFPQAFNNTGTGSIWLLGWDPDSPYPANDPYVESTAIRDGNWDFLSSSQRWLTNPGLSSKSLPDSLYLTGKPPFFGANPWPWVDPTTGATYVLPAKARYDAGHPNTP